MRSPADILEEVADLYESGEIGWTQHAFRRTRLAHPNSYCLIGSMRHRLLDAQKSYGLEYEFALKYLHGYIRENGHGPGVDDWNDMPGRTLDEVVDLLKTVAKDLRNKE
jgi:hypothetical protein